jgi:hypothetical protein
VPSRASNLVYREALKTDASRTARRMSSELSNIPAERRPWPNLGSVVSPPLLRAPRHGGVGRGYEPGA